MIIIDVVLKLHDINCMYIIHNKQPNTCQITVPIVNQTNIPDGILNFSALEREIYVRDVTAIIWYFFGLSNCPV